MAALGARNVGGAGPSDLRVPHYAARFYGTPCRGRRRNCQQAERKIRLLRVSGAAGRSL